MKNKFLLFFYCMGFTLLSGQENSWNVISESDTIDSLTKESDVKSYLNGLVSGGYYTLRVDSINLQKRFYYIHKGNRFGATPLILDSIGKRLISEKELSNDSQDSILAKLKLRLEERGYPFAAIRSKLNNDSLYISVDLTGQQRVVNGLVFHSDVKLPEGYKSELQNAFDSQIFNSNTIAEIDQSLSENPYLETQKTSQVLFLKDSTFIYVYPKRTKKSYFDGIIGFTNSESGKFKITGNVDLRLGNLFNALETLQLHWNSSANSSQDFNLNLDFPYIGNTPFGTTTDLKLFRQDSTFVNVAFDQNLFYRINRRSRIGLKGFLQSSTYLENEEEPTEFFQDFSKNGLGISYLYFIPHRNVLFEQKIRAIFQGNYLKSQYETSEDATQFHLLGEVRYLFEIRNPHYFFSKLRYENLLSDNYVTNELFRVGGIYSLRGFNENSIVTNSYVSGTLEYRYVPNDFLYLSAFGDLGKFENAIQNESNFLLGFGTGISFQTQFGLFSLQYALGKFPNNALTFDNSRIHIGIKALF